jgi:chemotaxis protein MotB
MSGPHKKGGHEEGGGHAPAWIVSFADMVILLMSFFVLLLCQGSQKTTTDEELLRILASVKVGFGYRPKPNSKDPIDMAVLQMLSQQQKKASNPAGQRWRSAAEKGQTAKEKNNWSKAQAGVWRPIRFARNSAILSSSANDNLEQIAEVVRDHFRSIVIQGHCSEEEAASDPEDGHELSFRRAIAVRNALRDKFGVAAKRMRIVSCSSHEPLKELKSPDRQVALVTIGEYFLMSEGDAIDEDPIPGPAEDKKPTSHGGH